LIKLKIVKKIGLDFDAQLTIKSTTCNGDMSKHFRLNEGTKNTFMILLLEAVKQPCTIDLSLDIKNQFSTQNSNYNHELYNIQVIIYQYKPDFTIVANLI